MFKGTWGCLLFFLSVACTVGLNYTSGSVPVHSNSGTNFIKNAINFKYFVYNVFKTSSKVYRAADFYFFTLHESSGALEIDVEPLDYVTGLRAINRRERSIKVGWGTVEMER